jgi:uncharacterized protein (TIRG00374 family)
MSNRLRTLAVSVLAIALVGWFLRDANLSDVWTHVRGARMDLLVIGLLMTLSTTWIRAVRWTHLLAPIGPTRFRTVFRCGVIGFAALAILPARVGDLLRPYLVARQDGLPVSAAVATIVMERVLDLITVLALMALYVWGFADTSTWNPQLLTPIEVSATLGGIASVALMAIMWVLASHPERIGTFVHAAAWLLPRPMAQRLAEIASSFSTGFAAARRPRELLLSMAWSLPLWLVIAGETWLVTRAFAIEMPFTGAFLLQAMLVVGVAVPTPGGVGSYHEAYRIGATSFFGASNDSAVAAAIVVHFLGFVPILLLGLLFMVQDGLSLGGLQAMAGSARVEKERPEGVPVDRVERGARIR